MGMLATRSHVREGARDQESWKNPKKKEKVESESTKNKIFEKMAYLPAFASLLFVYVISITGWNQKELAEALDVNPSFVSRVLRGQRGISLEQVENIARILKTPVPLLVWKVTEKPNPADEKYDLYNTIDSLLGEFYTDNSHEA